VTVFCKSSSSSIINSKKKSKNINNKTVDKIVMIMNDFGIGGEKSRKFGFQDNN